MTALHPPGRAGAYGQGEVRWDSHPQTEPVALLPSSCTFSPAGSLPCPRLPSSPSIPPALHPPGQPPWCRASQSGEGGAEPSGPPALGPSSALADLGPCLLDFLGHLGSPPAPVSLSVAPSPGHLFRGESFLLLQLLSQGREIQLWFWGKQFCQESGVNDRLHLGQKEEAVSILGRRDLGGRKTCGGNVKSRNRSRVPCTMGELSNCHGNCLHSHKHTHTQKQLHVQTRAQKLKHTCTETVTKAYREGHTCTNIYIHIYTSYAHRYTQTPRITRRSQDPGTEHKSHCPGPKPELGCQEDLSLESYRPRLQAQPTLVTKSSWEHSLSM